MPKAVWLAAGIGFATAFLKLVDIFSRLADRIATPQWIMLTMVFVMPLIGISRLPKIIREEEQARQIGVLIALVGYFPLLVGLQLAGRLLRGQ